MLVRHPQPVITRADIPPLSESLRDVSAVFNPGALREGDRDRLLLRVQDRGRGTHLLPAWMKDDRRVVVESRELRLPGRREVGREVFHVYDPRLTRLGGELLVSLALDLEDGCRCGLARWPKGGELEWLGLMGGRDERNAVLFPERLGGMALRLVRPNTRCPVGGPPTGDEIWLEESTDLLSWRPLACVARGRPRYWDEWIGPGPPPLRTTAGWLCLYHGVATHFAAANLYQAGALLLDGADPSRVLGRTRFNLLEPRTPWELTGQVPGVVFPSGLCVDTDAAGPAADEAIARIYYGAADTVVGLAEGPVGAILAACEPL
jgi:beta-1,4-mannooligosaccharide/beta-1,4-mannosyl-N-acetylglucosamine phosphorylase